MTLSPCTLRVMMIIGSLVMMSHWPGVFLLSLWFLVIWLVPRMHGDRHELIRLQGSWNLLDAQKKALEADLTQARQQVVHLAWKVAELEEELEKAVDRPQPATSGHPVFRRVGLDANCPRFVAEAVRKSYRWHLHPDRHPAGRKAEATRRFQDAEKTFDEIWRMRGF